MGKSLYDWCIENNREDLLKEYSDKNEKTINDIFYSSCEKVIWELPYDDLKTNKHFHFIWKGTVRSRTKQNHKCPYLSNQMVLEGFNDLKTWCENNNRQDLIEQFSPKNKKEITEFTPFSSCEKVIWQMPYDDPETGRHFDFEWESNIAIRTQNNSGCPFLPEAQSGRKVWKGYNDLETWCKDHNRQDLIDQFSPKNNLKMSDYTFASSQEVLWTMPYDDPKTGKHFVFEWKQKIKSRTTRNAGCPYIYGNKTYIGFNDLKTWCEDNNRPELIAQFSPKNKKDITEYTYCNNQKIKWCQPYDDPKTGKHFDFEWEQIVASRTIKGMGNPLWEFRNTGSYWSLVIYQNPAEYQWSGIKEVLEYLSPDGGALYNVIYTDCYTGSEVIQEWDAWWPVGGSQIYQPNPDAVNRILTYYFK